MRQMAKASYLHLQTFLVLLLLQAPSHCDVSNGTADGTEEWGYTDVRPGAHMFWWLYYSDIITKSNLPLVLWLQGGPGASGAGFGNFQEVGPLTAELKPRESTWLKVAHLLFVVIFYCLWPVNSLLRDVVDGSLLHKWLQGKNSFFEAVIAKTMIYLLGSEVAVTLCALCLLRPLRTILLAQVTDDLISFLRAFFGSHSSLKKVPFFIIAESYGGKFASELGVALQQKKVAGSLDYDFQGVALGDTWISPIDFLYAWPPLLKSFSEVDEAGSSYLLSFAQAAEIEMTKENFLNATLIWGDMEEAVIELTDNVDFYNLLKHDISTVAASHARGLARMAARRLKITQTADLVQLMNGPVRKKLGIIPRNVSWAESSGLVFVALSEDFMEDTIEKIDELLATGVNVTIYSGQDGMTSQIYSVLVNGRVSIDAVRESSCHGIAEEERTNERNPYVLQVPEVLWVKMFIISTPVAIFIAKLDLICCTTGTEAWIQKLKWPDLAGYNSAKRSVLYCDNGGETAAFLKTYKNLTFYWIMNAGHMVPTDNPCMALKMLGLITGQAISDSRSLPSR